MCFNTQCLQGTSTSAPYSYDLPHQLFKMSLRKYQTQFFTTQLSVHNKRMVLGIPFLPQKMIQYINIVHQWSQGVLAWCQPEVEMKRSALSLVLSTASQWTTSHIFCVGLGMLIPALSFSSSDLVLLYVLVFHSNALF